MRPTPQVQKGKSTSFEANSARTRGGGGALPWEAEFLGGGGLCRLSKNTLLGVCERIGTEFREIPVPEIPALVQIRAQFAPCVVLGEICVTTGFVLNNETTGLQIW